MKPEGQKIPAAIALSWFEWRRAQITMPGTIAMYDTAISALRAQAGAERNDPLTLDELRQMDGEPVWVCSPGLEDGMAWALADGEWALVDVKYDLCRASGGGLAVFENCGKT